MYSAISSSWINLNKLRVIRWFQMWKTIHSPKLSKTYFYSLFFPSLWYVFPRTVVSFCLLDSRKDSREGEMREKDDFFIKKHGVYCFNNPFTDRWEMSNQSETSYKRVFLKDSFFFLFLFFNYITTFLE
jgi:hypothetical protein